ncbi:MAG: hypothetical protein ACOY0T_13365 [Myxococcota bacterium]
MKLVTCVCALVAGTFAALEARATVAAFGMPERSIGNDVTAFRVGLDPVPLLELGYVRSALWETRGARFDAGVSLALPVLLGGRDYRLSLGLAPHVTLSETFALAFGAAGFWQRAEDETAHMQSFGFEVGVSPRYTRGGFYAGVPLCLRSAPLLFVENKAYMRFAYDDRYSNGASNDPGSVGGIAGPRDGTYLWTALRVFAGLEAGVTLEHWALAAGLGSWWTPQAQGLFVSVETGQIPVYLQLDIRRGF